jgi:hypothetical protein
MKRPVTPIFALTALGMLLGLTQEATLYAQNQSQVAACPLEGPSIADTLKYINDALSGQTDDNIGGTNFSLSVAGPSIVVSFVQTIPGYPPENQSINYAIYSLDCHAKIGNHPHTGDAVFSDCVNRLSCGKGTDAYDYMSTLILPFQSDKDHEERLARALSHLLAVLQQQYKQSHPDTKDPFAKLQ